MTINSDSTHRPVYTSKMNEICLHCHLLYFFNHIEFRTLCWGPFLAEIGILQAIGVSSLNTSCLWVWIYSHFGHWNLDNFRLILLVELFQQSLKSNYLRYPNFKHLVFYGINLDFCSRILPNKKTIIELSLNLMVKH